MHRLQAALLRDKDAIMAECFDGGDESAFVLAVVWKNANHGLLLTPSDRGAAVSRILKSHPARSDRGIASATGISARTVGNIRRSTGYDSRSEVRLSLDGRLRLLSAADGWLAPAVTSSTTPTRRYVRSQALREYCYSPRADVRSVRGGGKTRCL